jgi:LL-diaminopimelate aminotransferase
MSDYYLNRFDVRLDPNQEVIPLIGSKEGIANIAFAFIDPGAVALVPDPGYPTYRLGTLLAGGSTFTLPLLAENSYLPELEAIPIELAEQAKVLWLNYPNNPTGAVADGDFLSRAIKFAKRHDILICHDNPYCDITFDGYRAPSILQFPGAKDVAVEFNSLSKTYNMAGWRVGMAVGNAVAVEALARTKTNIDSGIFRPLQDAAAAALSRDQSWLQARNDVYRERRDLIVQTLTEVGIGSSNPKASLYVWARVPGDYTSVGFTTRLLEQVGISIAAGSLFGAHGEGYTRISMGQDSARIHEAMERLKRGRFWARDETKPEGSHV